MFSSIREFVRKHRKKMVFTGIVVAGTYAVGKYLTWKYEQWEEEKAAEFALFHKKQYHFESNQRTCTMTFLSFLPEIRNTIASKLNTETLLDVLKMKPSNKLEIWQQLKILSMSQMICSVISNVIILVLLKVHLNIMAGYMFVGLQEGETQSRHSGEEMNETQLSFMANIRYFIEQQLSTMIDDCMKIIQELLQNVSLKEKFSHEKLKDLTMEAMDKMKCLHTNERHSFCEYMIDNTCTENSANPDEVYCKMTSQSIDVLESKDCKLVIDECLASGIEHVLKNLEDSFCGSENPEAIVSVEQCAKASFYKPIDLPLAKIIPLLCTQLNEIFKGDSNDFMDVLFTQKHLRDWSRNIYDAFSEKY